MKELYHSKKFNNLLKHKIHSMLTHIFKQKHRLYSKIAVGLMSVFYLTSCEEIFENPQERGIDGHGIVKKFMKMTAHEITILI